MEYFDITVIVALIFLACFVVFRVYIVPILKEKYGEAQLDNIYRWVKIAVGAMEQIYRESGMGEKKKNEVLAFLRKIGITLDYDELNFLIEKAVYEINEGKINVTKMVSEKEKVA